MSEERKPAGPDLGQGVALADIADGGMLLGHAGGEAVLLARRGRELFAIDAECTHNHGSLAEGILVEDAAGRRLTEHTIILLWPDQSAHKIQTLRS